MQRVKIRGRSSLSAFTDSGIPLSQLVASMNAYRQEIVRPVLESPRKYVLLSLRKLARKLGCDPATLLRIIRAMGFSGFHAFQQYLHERSVANTTSLDLLQSTRPSSGSALLVRSLHRDMENLQILSNSIDLDRVAQVAERMYSARRIIILGADLASSLSAFLEHALFVIDLPAFVGRSAGPTTYLTHSANRRDLVIAISFRRGLLQTVEGLRQARSKGAYCVGITDNFVSPIAKYSDEYFLTSTENTSFASSYVAPMALLNTLLTACANCHRERTVRILKGVEREQRSGSRWYEGGE